MIKSILRTSKELLYDLPFYGSVLLSLLKEVDNKKTKTACVGLNGIRFKLTINSDFWDKLSDQVEVSDDYFKEYILHSTLVDDIDFDISNYCEHWEKPMVLTFEEELV